MGTDATPRHQASRTPVFHQRASDLDRLRSLRRWHDRLVGNESPDEQLLQRLQGEARAISGFGQLRELRDGIDAARSSDAPMRPVA